VMKAVTQAIQDDPQLSELGMLAPIIAKAAWAVTQPLQREREADRQRQSDLAYSEMEAALSEASPGWEEHEDEMAERITFLKNALTGVGPLRHPRFGTVLEQMYQLSSGPARATATAANRMRRAVLNRTATSQQRRSPGGPDTRQLIKEAGSMQDKIAIALRAAVNEVRQGG